MDGSHLDLNLHMCDLMEVGRKAWNVPVVTSYMSPDSIPLVLNSPLLDAIKDDRILWSYDRKGHYRVKSAYRLCMDKVLDVSYLKVEGNWALLCDLKVLPKVKNFLWRVGRECLPTRSNLAARGVTCSTMCPWCNSNIENACHVLIACTKSEEVWRRVNLWDVISRNLDNVMWMA